MSTWRAKNYINENQHELQQQNERNPSPLTLGTNWWRKPPFVNVEEVIDRNDEAEEAALLAEANKVTALQEQTVVVVEDVSDAEEDDEIKDLNSAARNLLPSKGLLMEPTEEANVAHDSLLDNGLAAKEAVVLTDVEEVASASVEEERSIVNGIASDIDSDKSKTYDISSDRAPTEKSDDDDDDDDAESINTNNDASTVNSFNIGNDNNATSIPDVVDEFGCDGCDTSNGTDSNDDTSLDLHDNDSHTHAPALALLDVDTDDENNPPSTTNRLAGKTRKKSYGTALDNMTLDEFMKEVNRRRKVREAKEIIKRSSQPKRRNKSKQLPNRLAGETRNVRASTRGVSKRDYKEPSQKTKLRREDVENASSSARNVTPVYLYQG